MARYTPLSERTKSLEVKGWALQDVSVLRFSGPETRSLAGAPHQVELHLDHMDDDELYNFARQLQAAGDAIERVALACMNRALQDEIPLP